MDPNIDKIGAPWWQKMLSRREANKHLAQIGGLALLLTSANIITGCDEEEDEEEVQRDALDLQKAEGWNIGQTDKSLVYPDKTNNDSMGSLDWSAYLDPNALLKAYQPAQSSLQPFVVPTLVQVLSQPSFRSQLAPICSNSMREAYSRGLGMREILLKTKNPENIMIISDLPGPESVAYAAALSDVADPVITFDNWPHPLGVVKSHLTLAALLYYAQEVSQKIAKRKDAPTDKKLTENSVDTSGLTAPAVIILDKNRLSSYTDADNQFDNRYIAKMPTAENLTTLKISNLIYSVPNDEQKAELDDLNDDFVLYKDKGLNVSILPLTQFQPSASGTENKTKEIPGGSTTTQPGTTTNVYHYGGGSSFLPYFFMWYALRPSYYYPSSYRMPTPTTISRPSYTPARRPTMFSSSNLGGAKGIGRAKPSGFGRVSTRVSSTGKTTGIRSGRSGSWGRSSGRSGRSG